MRELVGLIDHPQRPCLEMRDVAAARLSEVRGRIAELQALELNLGAFVTSCESSCAGGAVVDCTVLEGLVQPGRVSGCCANGKETVQ